MFAGQVCLVRIPWKMIAVLGILQGVPEDIRKKILKECISEYDVHMQNWDRP